jgi:hypothetical protein
VRTLVPGLLTLFSVQIAAAQDSVKSVKSPFDVATTMDKLTTALESKGMSIFGRIDHTPNAENASLTLRPAQVLIRHGMTGCDEILGKVSGALNNFAQVATRE